MEISTTETITWLAGLILAVVFRWFPVLAENYEAQTTATKQIVMLGALVVATVGIFAAGCGGLYEAVVACTQDGALSLARGFLGALAVNQGGANVLPKALSVQIKGANIRAAKLLRQEDRPKG
jgi:hypothetical protein